MTYSKLNSGEATDLIQISWKFQARTVVFLFRAVHIRSGSGPNTFYSNFRQQFYEWGEKFQMIAGPSLLSALLQCSVAFLFVLPASGPIRVEVWK